MLITEQVSADKCAARNGRHIYPCVRSTPQALSKSTRVTAPHVNNILASSIARDHGYFEKKEPQDIGDGLGCLDILARVGRSLHLHKTVT